MTGHPGRIVTDAADLDNAAVEADDSRPLAYFRRVFYTDGVTGEAMLAYALVSKARAVIADGEDYDDEPYDPTKDLKIGGSGGPTLYEVVSFDVANNYITVQPIGGGTSFPVALQPELRSTITKQTVDAELCEYSDYSGQARVNTHSGIVEDEVITPRFCEPFTLDEVDYPGDYIPVWPCAHTGVSVGDPAVELTLMAITGREWGKTYVLPE